MLQYLIHCTGCREDLVVGGKDAVAAQAVEHLRTVHAAVQFPSPGLEMLRVIEFSTFDYPTKTEQLKAGVPSEALAPMGEPQPTIALTVPDPKDVTF
jgi:hypothetical protein